MLKMTISASRVLGSLDSFVNDLKSKKTTEAAIKPVGLKIKSLTPRDKGWLVGSISNGPDTLKIGGGKVDYARAVEADVHFVRKGKRSSERSMIAEVDRSMKKAQSRNNL